MIKDLIGYQIIRLDEDGFTVRKGTKTKHFVFEHDDGDCCGYNDLRTELLINNTNAKNNPIITNIEYERLTNDDYGDALTITFFGLDKKLAEINSESASGSGWCYGACQWVRCLETNDEEMLTEW